MNDKGVLISYLGDFNQEVVNSLLDSVKKVVASSGLDYQSGKRFYAVAAECLDNIHRYNNKQENGNAFSKTFFNVSNDNNYYIIQTGNYIKEEQKLQLTEKLDKVNSLDRAELKKFYHEKLSESPARGGGLGIIDISIRSGCKINYEYKHVRDDVYFLVLLTSIKK
jgi:hypothetical protein